MKTHLGCLAVTLALFGCGTSSAPAESSSREDLTNDPCAAATYGDGDYCAKSLDPNATSANLYTCVGGATSRRVACANGCQLMPPGVDDRCAAATTDPCAKASYGDGDYCAASLDSSSTSPTLYHCAGGRTAGTTTCSKGCQKMPPGVDDVCSGGGGGTSDAVARAEQWVQVGMPYCGIQNHRYDSNICFKTCTRPDNPAWDSYRSDCSGLVSWAWGLPAGTTGGLRTHDFAPWDTSVSYEIDANDLMPGDALNSTPDEHIMLFAGWVDRANNRAHIIEEANCDINIQDHTLTVIPQGGSAVYVPDWYPTSYAAIRKR